MNESKFGLLIHNVVSIRAEPSGSAEQTSQAIGGDHVWIHEKKKEHCLVSTIDGYSGWAIAKQILEIEDEEIPLMRRNYQNSYRILDPIASLHADSSSDSPTLSRLPYWTNFNIREVEGDFLKILCAIGSGYIRNDTGLLPLAKLPLPETELVKTALKFVGTPYLWGGTTPFGFDCSGFVQRVYQSVGVRLPRDAYQQAESKLGLRLSETETLQCGDLVFFLGARDQNSRGITHVGMMLDDQQFIHAYGKSGVSLATLHDEEITKNYQYRGGLRLKISEKQEIDDPDS